MTTVKIVDRGNPKRHLGWFQGALFTQGKSLIVAASSRPRPLPLPNDPFLVDEITLTKDVIYSEDGWSAEVVLVTEGSLDVLLRVAAFTLPGEDPLAAKERRYAAGIYR